jgi:thiamine phosphate synthase YjbQ (UPF0047 family)
MIQASVFTDTLEIKLDTGPDIRDITDPFEAMVAASGIVEGHLMATMIGSTGSLTTIEFEPGVVADLKDAINRLAPPGMPYAHEAAWHDGNGHSHIQAALLGPSLALPACGRRLLLKMHKQDGKKL